MAKTVDEQNKMIQAIKKCPTTLKINSIFSRNCDLVFKGRIQPSGYTEPLLHQKRLEKKSKN